MKHGTTTHIKMRRLARLLGVDRSHAVGLIQCLWACTIDNAIAGDVGKLTDAEIADFCDWHKEPDKLIAAFIEAKWVDRCSVHRLVIHDWDEHAEHWVKKRARDAGVKLLHRGVDSPSSTDVQRTFNQQLNVSSTNVHPSSLSHTSPYKPSQAKPAGAAMIRFVSVLQATPIFAEYPRGGQVKKPSALRAILDALNDLDARGVPEPEAWLKARVIAFRESPKGKGGYIPHAPNWFTECRFDDPPEAWENPEPDTGKPAIDFARAAGVTK